jgi:hypothetical protein
MRVVMILFPCLDHQIMDPIALNLLLSISFVPFRLHRLWNWLDRGGGSLLCGTPDFLIPDFIIPEQHHFVSFLICAGLALSFEYTGCAREGMANFQSPQQLQPQIIVIDLGRDFDDALQAFQLNCDCHISLPTGSLIRLISGAGWAARRPFTVPRSQWAASWRRLCAIRLVCITRPVGR